MRGTSCLIAILMLFMLNSCTNLVNQQKVIIDTIFSTDLPWSVEISKGVSPTKQLSKLTRATVIIKDSSGNLIERLLHSENGIFISNTDTKPEIGKTYMLEVSPIGFETVSAGGSIPQVADVVIGEVTHFDLGEEQQIKLNLEIRDTSEEVNFYIIKSYILEKELGDISSNEMVFLNVKIDNTEKSGNSSQVYLVDTNLNSDTIKTQISIHSPFAQGINFENFDLYLVIESVDESVYRFHKSLDLYNLTSELSSDERSGIFTNVNNGLGVFGGFSRRVKKINLK